MATVTAQSLEGCTSCAIGDVDLAVAGTTANQQTRLVRGVLEEAQVANGTVVHRQLHFLSWKRHRVVKRTMSQYVNLDHFRIEHFYNEISQELNC